MEVPVVLKKEVIHDDYDVVLLKAFFAVNDMYFELWEIIWKVWKEDV